MCGLNIHTDCNHSLQEEVLSVEGAEEAHVEFTEEETVPEEVQYSLSEALKEAPKPSLVGTQEQVLEPQAAETFETDVSVPSCLHFKRVGIG